ncbi:hypothetical protein TI04_12750 [Achromatium sp. WMS2]|nr:hypothetical protein TI04_12750 [Achromatium sp. WMS2]
MNAVWAFNFDRIERYVGTDSNPSTDSSVMLPDRLFNITPPVQTENDVQNRDAPLSPTKKLSPSCGSQWEVAYQVNPLSAAAFGAGLYVVAGDSNGVLTSPDGINWTRRNFSAPIQVRSVTWSDTANEFVALGTGRTLFISSNGITWSSFDLGASYTLNSIARGDGKVIITGENVVWVHDGSRWTVYSFSNTNFEISIFHLKTSL